MRLRSAALVMALAFTSAAIPAYAQLITENFDSETVSASTFSEGGVTFTTTGSIQPVYGCRADAAENNYLGFGAVTGNMTITTPGKSFIIYKMDAWTSADGGGSSSVGDVLFVGTLAAGGTVSATIPVTPTGNSSADCDHIDFAGTALEGVPLTSLAFALPAHLNFIEVDNMNMNVVSSPTSADVPQSCADIRAVNRDAPDGVYVIVPNAKLFEVYCHDMAGTPAEYLPFVKTGGLYNFSSWAGVRPPRNSPAATLTTHYTMVRLDPVNLLVDIGDQTFATSSAGPVGGPGIPISSMPYATAADCRSFNTNFGTANVDLSGTPFIVDDSFVIGGWYSAGSANSSIFRNSGGNSSNIPVHAQVVNMTGGGFCGGIGPGTSWTINDQGGFDLQLKYTGPEATGPDACKKNGWKDFGDIFRNQGDCVSFFATGGRNTPAGGN